MPKKKNKKSAVTNQDNYAESFTNPQKLAEFLQKINEWKVNEPLLTYKNQRGENLIHAIILAPKKWELVRYIAPLAKNGVDLNHINNVFLPPIFLALQLKHTEAVRSLCDAGADLTVSTPDGLNILDITLAFSDYQTYRQISVFLGLKKFQLTAGNFLLELAENGMLMHMRHLQKKAKEWKLPVNINSTHPFNQRTAVIAAVNAKQLEVVNYLIENKADITIEDYQGWNALMHSIRAGDDKIFTAIAGSDEKLVNKIGGFGLLSPLQIAIEKNSKFIEPLLERKADINGENKNRYTALHSAIALNKVNVIQFIINHPAFDMSKFLRKIECLNLAIEFCDPVIFGKIFQIVRSFIDPDYEAELILRLYEFAISLEKESHFKFMVAQELNFYNYPDNPLNICCRLKKTSLIKWFFETQSEKITKTLMITSLIYSINHSSKTIVLLLSNLSFRFFEAIKKDSEVEYYAYRDALACICIFKNWLDLAIEFQPTLKFFMSSHLFREFSKDVLLSTISYLQGIAGVSLRLKNEKGIENNSFIFDPICSRKKILSSVLNCVPGMIDYIPDQKNPHHWVRFFYSSQPANPVYVPPVTDSKSKALTAFSFLRRQGLSDSKIQLILQENRERKIIPRLSFMDSRQTKNNQFLPCAWFGGQILSSHDYLMPIENAKIPNTFLLIPGSFKKIVPIRSRWRFHPDNGLKSLKGMPSVTVTLQFNDNQFIEYKTEFSHEIIWPGADRVLCITVPVDKPKEQRGVLILAVYYLEGGLHHHRTQTHLPVEIPVRMPELRQPGQNQIFEF